MPLELRERDAVTQTLNDLNREIVKRLYSAHHHIPSGTELNGAFAIRPCYINPRTTLTDVDGLAQEVERLGAQVWRDHHGEGIVS